MTYFYGQILHPLFFKYFNGRQYPGAEHIDGNLFRLHVREIKKEITRLLPKSKFSVMAMFSPMVMANTEACLKSDEVTHANYEGHFAERGLTLAVTDGHLNLEGNLKISEQIVGLVRTP